MGQLQEGLMVDETFENEDQQEAQPAEGSLEQELEEEKKKSAEYLDSWRRSAADFANYKKRVEKERGEYTQFANINLLRQLIDVLDGFDAAFKVVPKKLEKEAWVEGLRLVEQKLKRIMENEGVKPIETEGKDFDPKYHEAMYYEPTPGEPEGRVTGEYQRGYTLGERVLRPSRVKVAKGEDEQSEK